MTTPRLNATGRYTVAEPFDLNESLVYKCEALVGFSALELDEVDIYSVYYAPYGIDTERFEEDRVNEPDIVTLMGADGTSVILPASFILTVPTGNSVPYQQVYLAVSLGALPVGFDVSIAKQAITEQVKALTGIDSETREVGYPALDIVSYEQHEVLEAARIANIEFKPTDASLVLSQQEEINQLRLQVAFLEEAIIELQD